MSAADPRDPGVLRRADQHGQLSRVRSGDPARRRDRPGARLRSRLRRGRHPLGRRDPRGRREGRGVTIDWALETHAHADHLSGAPYIKAKTGAKIGIGEHIKDVQQIFRPVFNATDLHTDGRDFDQLFADGETFAIGELDGRGALHARPHARRRQLQDRRRRVRRRHAVHARLRHRARRFPRRRRAQALSLDPAAARPAARDAAVHVPRLQGAGPRRLCLGDHGARPSARAASTSRTASARTHFVAMRDGARSDARRAAAAAALDPGQHPRRPLSAAPRATASTT